MLIALFPDFVQPELCVCPTPIRALVYSPQRNRIARVATLLLTDWHGELQVRFKRLTETESAPALKRELFEKMPA